ncbi:nuclear transport factor 2 family protein [Actinoplanes sp. NPDC051851]|uniref:nuclear transport factor 2 family protein n=1 Tax=Actinoplanes sp. NPDC051851 TaxID=3154753 RepID=UPI0034345E68
MSQPSPGSLVDRYVAAWTTNDHAALGAVLAPDVRAESNVGLPGRFLPLQRRLAAVATVTVVSRVDAPGRSMLIYECSTGDGGARTRVVEYLTLDDDRVSGIRHVYDIAGLERAFPELGD